MDFDPIANSGVAIMRRNASTNALEFIGVTPGAALPVTTAAGGVVTTGGVMANPAGSTTLPNSVTTYAVGDLVANSATAGSVVPISISASRIAAGSFMLRRAKLAKSGSVLTNASFRIHLWTASPTVTNGDDGAFLPSGVADYRGAFDVTIDRAFSDGAAGFGLPVVGFDMNTKLASGSAVFVLLEARAAYTRVAAEVFTVSFDDLQD
jgi:hypothetical protein